MRTAWIIGNWILIMKTLDFNNERRQTGFSQQMAESWACIFGVHCQGCERVWIPT